MKVDETDLENFKEYVQWCSAAICNDGANPGTPLECGGGGCPKVNATMVKALKGAWTHATGIVAKDPVKKKVVVAFRGTHNIFNVITDAIFNKVECQLGEGCWVHKGFQFAWDEIAEDAEKAVQGIIGEESGWSLVFTGHSLGAAVATLGAGYFRQKGIKCDLYTYGSPRVGNAAFAEFITKQEGGTYRVTHFNDLVPQVPTEWFKYQHVDPEYWLADGPTDRINYDVNDIKTCSAGNRDDCNAGTWPGNRASHGFYFQEVGGCGNKPIEFISQTEFDKIVELMENNGTKIEARKEGHVV